MEGEMEKLEQYTFFQVRFSLHFLSFMHSDRPIDLCRFGSLLLVSAKQNFSEIARTSPKHKSSNSGQKKRIHKVVKVSKSQVFYYLKRCVWGRRTSDFYYILIYFAFREPTTSPTLSHIHPSFTLQPAVPLIDNAHPKRNNTISSPALTMMHGPDGKHSSGVVIMKPFFFLTLFFFLKPRVKEIQKTGPKV